MKRFLTLVISISLLLTVLTSCVVKNVRDGLAALAGDGETSSRTDGDEPKYEDFSFSLTWNCYGESSYDSETGILVKQSSATNVDEFTTTLILNDEQLAEAYYILSKLDYSAYPENENYDPGNGESMPSETIILTVRIGDAQKTITAEDISLAHETRDKDGQAFLDACDALKEIIYSSKEWKSLPEYEFLYE